MLEERIQTLLDAGIDVNWFGDCSRDLLRGYLANLQAHRCRLDAVEANVVLALNRLDKQTAPKARPSDVADDIRDQTGKSNAEANRTARRAELFDRWPQISAALAASQIGSGHADLLTAVPQKYHDALETDLAALLAKAATETVDEFKETLRNWKDQTAKDAGDDPHQRRHQARQCSIRKDADGMIRISATLHPEAGAKVRNALTAIAQNLLRQDQQHSPQPDNHNDDSDSDGVDNDTNDDGDGDRVEERTHPQRLADALTQLAEQTTTSPGTGPKPGHGATVVVTIALEDLRSGLDGQAHNAGPISADTVRKLACENGVIPAVLNSTGAVVDLGRRNRLATTSQRLALQTQYHSQCAVPQCDRPFEWCHIHHIDQWEHGGPTNLENLIPVCTRHHTQIHDGRLTIKRTNKQDHWHRKPHKHPNNPKQPAAPARQGAARRAASHLVGPAG